MQCNDTTLPVSVVDRSGYWLSSLCLLQTFHVFYAFILKYSTTAQTFHIKRNSLLPVREKDKRIY